MDGGLVSARAEWGLRVTFAGLMSTAMVLAPYEALEIIRFSAWVPVIAITQSKPTVGDTLQGWWDVMAPGMCRQRHATPHHATPRHATPRHTTPRHATPRHATGVLSMMCTMLVIALLLETSLQPHPRWLAVLAMIVIFGAVTLIFGDHIQARWACLIALSGLLNLGDSSSEDIQRYWFKGYNYFRCVYYKTTLLGYMVPAMI
jgi:hypothetical protein